MTEAIKGRWVLILMVIAFVVAKIPVLHYPFFWDESWSYVPGIKLMYQHGPSLMPNAIDLFYSRGHPLLFYASAAAWMHVFGTSNIAMHSFGLFISVLLLITVHEICLKLFNKKIAILALLLVAGQVIFFVQSTMLLPEVMITWLSLLTLYYYSSQKYWQTFIACTALLFTKESGMALGLILGIHAVLYFFNKTATPAQKFKNFLPVFCSGICIGLFYLLQKKLNGWYLFPEHTGLIDLGWITFKGKLRFCAEIIFYHQFREWLFLLLIAASVFAAIKTRNFRYALPLLTGLMLYVYIGEHFGYLTRRLFIPFLFISLIHTFYSLIKLHPGVSKPANRFIYLTLFFLGAYLSFSSLNFFTNRYLLCCIVLFVILAAWCFELFASTIKNVFVYLIADCIILIFLAFKFNSGINDTNLGAYPAMEVQQDIVNYFEANRLYNNGISAYSQLHRAHLTKPITGFRHTPDSFTYVTNGITLTTEFVIKDNIEIDSSATGNTVPDAFRLVYETKKGEAWGAIYKKL
jgi:hypothetical protein